MISTLNISDTVEICVLDKDHVKQYFRTKVEDIGSDNIFYTMVPTSSTGRPVLFGKGQIYEMYLRKGDGISMWYVKYITSTKEDNRISCQFQAVKGPVVTQRREFFRQPVSINIDFILLTENPEEGVESRKLPETGLEELFLQGRELKDIFTIALSQGLTYEKYDGRMVDISGGGCAFASNALIAVKSKILIAFTFRGKKFEFEALVLDRTKFTNNRTRWDYRYRVQWLNTRSRVVDDLVTLVFAEQREMMINNGTIAGNRFM